MLSEVTLSLENPQAWQAGLTFQQSCAAGTSYDSMMLHNYAKRAACISPVRTFGLDTVIEAASGYQVYVAAFDSDLNYLGYNESGSSRGWKNPPYTFSSASAEYICIAVKSSPEADFTDAMLEDMNMSVTLAGGGGSMTDAYSREEAYELNEIAGWEEFAYGPTANPTTAKFRNAGSGNGWRIWGLSEDGLPMGATGYMSIDTSAETCTNSDNTISQDSVPLVVGEVYTIGAFVRGKGYFTCGPTQDGYYRARSEHVDHPNWRFYGGVFTAKSTSQNMYWRNETIATSEYAGKLDISAPILVRGGGGFGDPRH